MARLNDDAQWIVLMGFMVSFSLFFLGIVINQSTVIGQTTAESVLEFPKNDILDARDEILKSSELGVDGDSVLEKVKLDISSIALSRKNAIVSYKVAWGDAQNKTKLIDIHYNNGVTAYDETANY
jgi:hypothetical protein